MEKDTLKEIILRGLECPVRCSVADCTWVTFSVRIPVVCAGPMSFGVGRQYHFSCLLVWISVII